MNCYKEVKDHYQNHLPYAYSEPIRYFGYIVLQDAFLGFGALIFFILIYFSPLLMFLSLIFFWGVLPRVKKRSPRGIILHALLFNGVLKDEFFRINKKNKKFRA